jgi:hypothetical protein
LDESDMDLSMRLELARQNSQSQHGQHAVPLMPENPVEETIYEGGHYLFDVASCHSSLVSDEPPHPLRPASRASGTFRDAASYRSTTPTPRPSTPTRSMDSTRHVRSTSQHSSERRPMGPRAPSPLPPKSPLLLPSELPDADLPLEQTLVNVTQPSTPTRTDSVTSPYRRGNRQPLVPTGNTDPTPKHSANGAVPSSIEPLSIKKKTSLRTNASAGSPTQGRKVYTRNSPLNRASSRIASPRRVSPQVRSARTVATARHSSKSADAERIKHLAQTTKEDVRILCP